MVNADDREAAAWLLTAILKPHGWTYLPFDQACGKEPLPPQQARHCRALVSWELEKQELAVTAVVFADGSSAGDLEPLRNEGETRAVLSEIDAYWSRRALEISESLPAPEALRRLEREIRSPVERSGYDVYAVQALIELDILRGYVRTRIEAMKLGEDAQALERVRSDLESSARCRADAARRIPLRRAEEQPPPARLPEVENLTGGLEVVRVQRENANAAPRLVLKNNYERPIMAYTISERRDGGMRRSTGEDLDCYSLGWAPSALRQAWPTTAGGSIVVSSAVFEDGSGDGDGAQVHETVDNWRRQRDVLRQHLPLLEDLLRLSDAELPAATDELIARLSPAGAKGSPASQPGCREPEHMASVLRSSRKLPPSKLRAAIQAEIDAASVRLKRP